MAADLAAVAPLHTGQHHHLEVAGRRLGWASPSGMLADVTREELLRTLSTLAQAPAGASGIRAPHKPLLLLMLLGRLQSTGSSQVIFEQIRDPLSLLIADYAPIPTRTRPDHPDRAALPFVKLERTLWAPVDGFGTPLGSEQRTASWLVSHGATGALTAPAEAALADPVTLGAAVQVLLDTNFTDTLAEPICTAAGVRAKPLASVTDLPGRRPRDPEFPERVYRAYDYACAICGFDGALGRSPVGLDAAHVWWHSRGGPDDVSNGAALCALHHRLFDTGVIGLNTDGTVKVSTLFVARGSTAHAVRSLAGTSIRPPAPGHAPLAKEFINWHTAQVFKQAP